MLVTHRSKRQYQNRYYGSGMLDDIGRQVFSRGFKKAITNTLDSCIAHKDVDAVVDGATSAVKKAATEGAKTVGKKAEESVTRKLKKRPASEELISIPSKRRVDINSLVNSSSGSGIVLD